MWQDYSERQDQEARRTLTDAERLAIWALRRVMGCARCCFSAAGADPGKIESELATMTAVFRDLFRRRDRDRGFSVQIGVPESMVLTKDERRLLNAIAAAQAEDHELLDNYLYKLALDHKARSRLSEAVASLAACLAVQGYWLTRPLGAVPISGAALAVARAHGREVQDMRVAWP